MVSTHRGRARKDPLIPWLLAKIPLAVGYTILFSSWIGFTCAVSIIEVLGRQGDVWRFTFELCTFQPLVVLAILSFYCASTRSPGHPRSVGQGGRLHSSIDADTDYLEGTSTVDEAAHHAAFAYEEEDDLPLAQLRNHDWAAKHGRKDRPSPLPISHTSRGLGDSPKVSPFPLSVPRRMQYASNDDGYGGDGQAAAPLLSQDANKDRSKEVGYWYEHSDKTSGGETPEHTRSGGQRLMAKPDTGRPRFCRKCIAGKPDRAHHCSTCGVCVLKMDHHCVWIGGCVGYGNYKPFLLFVTYGTLLAVYSCIESAIQLANYVFSPTTRVPSTNMHTSHIRAEAPSLVEVDLSPVIMMSLVATGFFMTLAVGGLAIYHWYLTCNNLTTLENMSHSYPTALLIDDHSPSRLRLPDAGGRTTDYSHTPISPHWRPDHLLDRTERLELQRSARELNVYDLGWRRNIMAVLAPHERGRYRLSSTLLMLWPLTAPPSATHGEDFDYDDDKLEKLRRLTRRLRMADAAAEADEEMWEDD